MDNRSSRGMTYRNSLPHPFRVASLVMVVIWAVFILGKLPLPLIGDLFHFGIIPRHPLGLLGILTSPWVHADLNHLLSNQALILHVVVLSLLKPGREAVVILLLILSTGIGVWLFGMAGNHIGASGLVFALQGFNLLTALYQRRWGLVAVLSVIMVVENSFVYGLFGWFMFNSVQVSYSSHIFGLISGVLWSWILREHVPSSTGI